MPPQANVSAAKIKPKQRHRNLAWSRLQLDNSVAYGILLPALAVIAYASSLHGKFVFDDQQIVMQNPQLMNVKTVGDAISLGAGWRQLLFFTYGLNYYASGLDTFSYHVVNVFVHCVMSFWCTESYSLQYAMTPGRVLRPWRERQFLQCTRCFRARSVTSPAGRQYSVRRSISRRFFCSSGDSIQGGAACAPHASRRPVPRDSWRGRRSRRRSRFR